MSGGEPLAGRYRLTGELGHGGMGTVWRARDEKLNREVAIKELAPPRETSEARRELAVQRALREARAAARLRHPGIITVHDVVLAGGRPWIVMELLSGRSLNKVVEREGPMEPRRAAALGIEILDALRAAHARGVLHRDVKPANVFLRDDGRAVLTDFGIASLAGDAPLTRPGALIGSPAYMAPERIRGEPGGPPSDLWSLGATLYALVEGRPPFAGSTPMGMLGAVLADEPAAPQRAGPLAGLLVRLLIKDPAGRPDAAQIRRELAEAAGATKNAEATRSGTGRRPRRNVAIGVALLACLIAGAVTGVTLLRHGRSGHQNRQSTPLAGRSAHRAGGPTPLATAPPMCGMISVTQMNTLVPDAGAVSDTSENPNDYFNPYAHRDADGCIWNEHSYVAFGHIASARARPAGVGPPDDPMKPARDVFARLRRDGGAAPLSSGDYRSAPRPVPGIGDEAFAYDQTTSDSRSGQFDDSFFDSKTREDDAFVDLRIGNMLIEVRYGWSKKGATPPGGLGRLREGAAQIAQWMAAAFRAGRPPASP